MRLTTLEARELEARAERSGLPVHGYVRWVLGWRATTVE